jgi:hypothetical protein
VPQTDGSGRLSTSLMKALKTRAYVRTRKLIRITLESAPPAASNTLFGCQSTPRTVLRIGFFRCLLTHQSPSSSKLQILIALALDPHANLFSRGDHRTNVAALFIRRRTRVGFHVPSLWGSQTYALRYIQQDTNGRTS